MAEKESDPLEKHLSKWKVSFERDPLLSTHVLNRISSDKHSGLFANRLSVFRWAGGIAAMAALIVGALIINQQFKDRGSYVESSYLQMIDPVFRIHAESRNELQGTGGSLIQRLAWMQDKLELSQDQFMDLVELHTSYAHRFDELYEELVRLEDRYEEFEELRKQNEMIDFIALYEVLTERKEMEQNSGALSSEFVAKVASHLRPDQRISYLSLVKSPSAPDA